MNRRCALVIIIGLHYAFTYKANRSDPSVVWKFNKARQIWLSKNIWQPEVVS